MCFKQSGGKSSLNEEKTNDLFSGAAPSFYFDVILFAGHIRFCEPTKHVALRRKHSLTRERVLDGLGRHQFPLTEIGNTNSLGGETTPSMSTPAYYSRAVYCWLRNSHDFAG
ncbi:hypothetical protein AVEN_115279-1 [Araneus ventricosus]|uniref:Uncharacterized protein n=1 Tax=Araneus ventricosus TaxID=182803 RepID=A0A4Y1ZYH9_ARAVE|nr:hypothetical protein AVEN_115279-1 [Araneus ventricosus]